LFNNLGKKTVISILIVLSILLLFQLNSIKTAYLKRLELKIKAEKALNRLNYQKEIYKNLKSEESNEENLEEDVESVSAALIKKCSGFGIELINYSSSDYNLNLNIKGDFKSLFAFADWLDQNYSGYQINKWKLKKDDGKIISYLQLRNKKQQQ